MTMHSSNAFETLAALGYRRLVPIIPPTAPISERSSLHKRVGTLQDGRGKTPGIRGRDGNWFGFDWIPYEADEQDLQRWHRMGAGVGIKTGDGLVAIDADTTDPTHAATIRAAIAEVLGELPIRIGQPPKALYPVRVATAFPYGRVEFGPPRETGAGRIWRVEILSEGRQFVASGIHPKTREPYRWERPLLPLEQLPIATPQQLVRILDLLRERLPDTSEIVREGSTATVSQAALTGKLETVRRAVEATPNTSAHFPSRESYRDFGYAIKAALPDDEPEAFGLFADWCARWADGDNDPEIVAADWRRMKGPFRRGASWLYELASEIGDGFSAAEPWFEDLDAPANPFEAVAQAAAAAETGGTDVYPVVDLDELMTRPPPRMLIARHIPEQSLGFIYGEPGSFKSFLILDAALHLAAGDREWNGDELVMPEDAVVVYLAAEGSFGFRARIKAWLKRNGRSLDELSGRFKMIERTINFMEAGDVAKLIRTVRTVVGRRPCLVVVDTVSRALPGADENLQKDMTLFVRACDALKEAFRCAVVGVHHAGKSGDMRGSTVLRGAGDFVFRMTRRPKSHVVALDCEKQKDGPDGWGDTYLVEPVEVGDGETSLVIERTDMGIGPDTEVTPELAARVLAAIGAAWEAGEPWAMAPQARDRFAVRRLVADFGMGADTAEQTLRTWEATGLICTDTVSTRNKRKGLRVVGDLGQDVRNIDIFA